MEYLVMNYDEEMKALNALMDKEEANTMAGIQDYGKDLKRGFDYGKPRIAGPASVMMNYRPQDTSQQAMQAFGGASELAVKNSLEKRKAMIDRYRDIEKMKAEEDLFSKKLRAEAGEKARKQGEEAFKQSIGLIGESAGRLKEPTQRVRDVESALKKIEYSANTNKDWQTGAGELASLYNFVKLLDPGSVVREGEISLTEQASPLLQKVANLHNKYGRGQRIPPEVKQEMVDIAKQVYGEELGIFKKFRGQEENYLKSAKVAPELLKNAPFYSPYDPGVVELNTQQPPQINAPINISKGGLIREAGAAETQTKQLGGKTYRKVPGGWVEVE